MKFKALLCAITLFVGWAQHASAQIQRTCGTDAYYQEQVILDPQFEVNVVQAKLAAKQWLKNNPAAKQSGVVTTIPVVFHVVYANMAQNISDAQIISQLAVLNADFRKLNTDTGSVPSEFKPVAADSEIEFCFALRDPSGNPTNGITRTSTTAGSFSSNDAVKQNSTGGKDGWPRNDYLNYWICNLGSGLLGYATFPGGTDWRDGVVCGYDNIGAPPANTFGGPYDQGRTGTHEIGHWLGLSHTFSGGCTFGDGIADTPPTDSSNFGCPSIQNTCSNDNPDMNDMTMNYMDYADDLCMYIFTEGQKDVMQGVLSTSRSSLKSSPGCAPLINLDASIAIATPSDTICGISSFIPKITLINNGTNTLTTVDVTYQFDSEPAQTFNWSGNLASFSSEDIVLAATTLAFGDHTFNTYVSNPNSGMDELTSNDTSLINFHFKSGNVVTLTLIIGNFQPANLVSWDMRDTAGNIIDSVAGYSKETTNIETVCLAEGCYTFNLYYSPTNAIGSLSLVDIFGDTITTLDDFFDYSYAFCVTATGVIENRAMEPSFRIFPNPSNGIFSVQLASLFNGKAHLRVFSARGEVCIDKEIQSAVNRNIQLDLTGKASGLYFVQITDEKGTHTQKLSLLR